MDLTKSLYLKKSERTWISLLTCAVYSAVHFELIKNLSTNGFMLELRKIILRRGRSKVVYSENGTKFGGAEKLLKSLDWTKITHEASVLRFQ